MRRRTSQRRSTAWHGVRQHGGCQSDGFAAVDALVALLILSATLVFCLDGLRTADHLSRLADETGQATRLAKAVLADTSTTDRPLAGRSGTLSWTVADQAADGADTLCARTMTARSLRDGHTYRFTTARPCS